MPIISISINESLKKFITKLINNNTYENKSKLIRDALLRLMSSPDISAISDGSGELFPIERKKITGSMIIVAPNDLNVIKN